jgi:hypothetical protein
MFLQELFQSMRTHSRHSIESDSEEEGVVILKRLTDLLKVETPSATLLGQPGRAAFALKSPVEKQ